MVAISGSPMGLMASAPIIPKTPMTANTGTIKIIAFLYRSLRSGNALLCMLCAIKMKIPDITGMAIKAIK